MANQLVRVGNTVTVEVPAELLAETGLEPGDSVEWVKSANGNLFLVAGENLHSEIKLASQALASEDEAEVLAHIRAGMADFEAGRSVSHEKVTAWLDSWGTEHELPVPELD